MNSFVVAINVSTLGGWGGGIDFLRMIIYSLLVSDRKKNSKIYLLFPYAYSWDVWWKKSIKHIINKILISKNIKIKKWHFMSKELEQVLIDFGSNICIEFYKNGECEPVLKKIGADIIFPIGTSASLKIPKFPFIGYIFDFQHKYFPDFFSVKDYMAREQSFAYLLLHAPALIVHSAQVKLDIERFYPVCSCKVFDLPFAAVPIEKEKFQNIAQVVFPEVKRYYNLPDRYFVICNQFWVHKDHMTAFRALVKLCDKNIHIVCTGKTFDYRMPNYFKDLQKEIANLGIQERIHFLGYIPKEAQLAVMYGALALIQPTLFDGSPGGIAGGEAVALGVPVILSDIPVNKLVSGNNIIFFKAKCSEDLVMKMQAILDEPIKRLPYELLYQQSINRIKKFGDRLYNAFFVVLKNKGKTDDT